MASRGEEFVRNILVERGYQLLEGGNVDCLAIKDRLCLIIEEKDNKYPLKVGKTRVYSVAGRKTYPFRLKQMGKHTIEVIDRLKKSNRFFILLQVYVVSNMVGRYVNVLRHYKSNIFFINKSYFLLWLKHLEYVYLGSLEPFPNRYMGGI